MLRQLELRLHSLRSQIPAAGVPIGPQSGESPRLWPIPVGQTRQLCLWLLLALGVLYLLQIPSPLRLNFDSIHLLGVGENLFEGRGFVDHGQRPVFPPGFPLLVAGLLKTGLPAPPALAAFNVILLAAGLYAVRSLLLKSRELSDAAVLGILCLFLLSVVVIKHSAIPLTDIPFFALASTSLLAMQGLRDQKLGGRLAARLALALLLVCAATLVRTIGVALWPAWMWCVLGNAGVRSLLRRIPRQVLVATVLAMVVAASIVAWHLTQILRQYFLLYLDNRSLLQMWLGLAGFRMLEFGQLALNLPKGVFPVGVQWILRIPGCLLLATTALGFAARRRRLDPTDVFFGFYSAILAIWPHFDSRFWLPVLPLLLAYLFAGLKALKPSAAIVRWMPLGAILYAMIGLLSLVYSTNLTYSGKDFPSLYPEYSNSYCVDLYVCDGGARAQDIDAVHILRRFR